MNDELTSILGEPENKPTSDLVSILGEPELKKKEPSVSESSDGRYYAVSTPDRQLLETGEVTKTGQPKEDKQKATVLAGIKSPEERTIVSKAIDLTNEGYEGVMTPYQKMTEFSNQVKELNKSVDAKAIASMDKTALDKFQSDYKKKAHDIAVNLGLQVDEAGNVKPYEEESQRYADKLNFNIGLISQKQKPEEKGFFGNLITALGAGQERASGAALDLLGFVTGLNYFDSYRDLAKGNRYNAQALSEQANRYDQSIENYMAQGDITKAAGAAITGAAESLPYMIPAMVNPEYGAYVMGSMAGIDQYRNLETKDIPEWAKVANAVQTAAWEAIFEDVGTASILSRSKQAMLELGEKQGKEAILNAVNKTVENNASKLGKMPEWVKEGLSEVATGIGEDITDKVTYNPDAKIGSHAVDDFTVGAVMGKLFSIPQDIAKFADRKAVRDYSQKIIDSLPVDMDIPTKVELGWKIAERNKLQEAEDRLDEKFKGKYTERINSINSEIDDVIAKWKGEETKVAETKPTEEIVPGVVPIEQPTEEQKLKDIENGNVSTFVFKTEEEIPDVLKDKVSSTTDINGEKQIRVTLPKSEADYLLQEQAIQQMPEVVPSGIKEQAATETIPEQIQQEVKTTVKEEFKPFADVVLESKSVDEAFNKVQKIKDVSPEVSKMFRETYDPNENLTPKQAFESFYNEVKQQKQALEAPKVEEGLTTPKVEETAIETPEISFTDVKDRVGRPIYESEEQAKTDYDTNSLKEHEETYDEFLRRKHCSGIKPRNFSLK